MTSEIKNTDEEIERRKSLQARNELWQRMLAGLPADERERIHRDPRGCEALALACQVELALQNAGGYRGPDCALTSSQI